MKTYHLLTFGCQMNEYDSAMIAEMFEQHGALPIDSPEQADYVIVNTCSIREKAEETAYSRISQLKPFKRAYPAMKIAVIGCMARNHGERLLKAMPHVDLVMGPDNYGELNKFLEVPVITKAARKVITEFDSIENYVGRNAKVQHPFSTAITIQRGCNKRCTFCIVPFVRGNEKYRTTADILRETEEAVQKGVVEVTLLGQTVNSFRYEGDTFASLVMKVAQIPGIERIRFSSPHPKHFTDDLLWVLTHEPKVCPHAHLPVQSGSNEILHKMRRQYDREQYLSIIERLRAYDPLFGITTDVIAGFVGESEADFAETVSLLEQVRFDSAFLFAYSPREGTMAYQEAETLSEDEKQARLQTLVDMQNAITLERNMLMLGRTENILLEGPSTRDSTEWVGKTPNFKRVILPHCEGLRAGATVPALLTEIRGWTLRGQVVERSSSL